MKSIDRSKLPPNTFIPGPGSCKVCKKEQYFWFTEDYCCRGCAYQQFMEADAEGSLYGYFTHSDKTDKYHARII